MQENLSISKTFLGSIKGVLSSVFDHPMKIVPKKAKAEYTVSSSTMQYFTG